MGSKALPDYSASKGAIHAFTKTLAQELMPRGIRVNAVAPGPVWTPLNPSDGGLTADEVAQFGSDSPMKRPAQPEEVAPAYVYLASDADSSYTTGIVLQVMGGETTGGCILPQGARHLTAPAAAGHASSAGRHVQRRREVARQVPRSVSGSSCQKIHADAAVRIPMDASVARNDGSVAPASSARRRGRRTWRAACRRWSTPRLIASICVIDSKLLPPLASRGPRSFSTMVFIAENCNEFCAPSAASSTTLSASGVGANTPAKQSDRDADRQRVHDQHAPVAVALRPAP